MKRELAITLVLWIAKSLAWVRELTGANDGPPVEAIQRSTGNKRGDAWCASFVWFCIRVLVAVFGADLGWLQTASCDEIRKRALARGLIRVRPKRGHLGLVKKSETDAIHVFFVDAAEERKAEFLTIEGNTNPGGGRDGYGVFPRTRGGKDDPAIKAKLTYEFVDWASLLGA